MTRTYNTRRDGERGITDEPSASYARIAFKDYQCGGVP